MQENALGSRFSSSAILFYPVLLYSVMSYAVLVYNPTPF
jgi:hypothetical protein